MRARPDLLLIQLDGVDGAGDEHVPLDRARLGIAVLALAIFIVSFTPAPIEVIQLLPR